MRLADLKTPWSDPQSNLLHYCLQHYDYFKDHYRDFHAACEDELDFSLRLNHYINDRGNTRNKRTLLKGAELFHIHRHKVAAIGRAESYIDAFPRNGNDEKAEEFAANMRAVLISQMMDPVKRYKRNKRRVISGAHAARAWGMAIETARGPDGRMGLQTRTCEPTRLMPHPGWADPHDPTCPSMMEELILRTEDVYAMALANKWDNADRILPDGTTPDTLLYNGRGAARGITYGSGLPGRGVFVDEWTKVVRWWVREDHTKTFSNVRKRERKQTEPTRMCDSCGTTFMPDDTAGQMNVPCPVCDDGMTIPIQYQDAEVTLMHPNGVQYVFAPELQLMFRAKAWPYNIRAFPYLWYTAYEHPREPFGQSDTSLYWGVQVMLNRLRMFGYNQMMNSPDILIAPFNGLVDAKRRPFVYSDEQGRIAYFTNFQEAQGIRHFQGPGLPQAWSTLHGALMNDFTRTWGISDMGMDASASRKIPVGTMQRLVENAELPVDEHIARFREEESVLWNVGGDMMYEVIVNEGPRQVQLEDEGERKSVEVSAENIAPADVVFIGTPDYRALKKEELDGVTQMAQMPPYVRRWAARAANIPMRDMRKLEEDEAKFQQAQASAAQAAEGPPAGVPGQSPITGPPTEEAPPEGAMQLAQALGL